MKPGWDLLKREVGEPGDRVDESDSCRRARDPAMFAGHDGKFISNAKGMGTNFFANDPDPKAVTVVNALEEMPVDPRHRKTEPLLNVGAITSGTSFGDEVFEGTMAEVEKARKVNDARGIDVVETDGEFGEIGRDHGRRIQGEAQKRNRGSGERTPPGKRPTDNGSGHR